MSRKLLAVCAIVVSICFVLVGCGQGTTSPSTETSAATTAETSTEASADVSADVSAEASVETSSDHVPYIGVAVHGYTEYGAILADACKAQLDSIGYDSKILNGEWTVETQNNQIETLITDKVDGCFLFPVDADATVPACEDLYDAGIPTIVINTKVNTDKYTAFVGPPNVTVGEDLMNWVADKLGGKGNIVILQGTLGLSAETERHQGIQSVLDKYPDIQVLAIDAANWARDEGLSKMENWLQLYGVDQIDAVVAENDEMALGALQAIQETGTDKHIIIGAIDGIEDACNAIKAGDMDVTFWQDADGQAVKATELIQQLLNGETLTDKDYWVPFQEVNADNADAYIAKYN